MLSLSDIFKLMLLKHLTLPQDTLMTYLLLIILIANKRRNQIYPTELQLNKAKFLCY